VARLADEDRVVELARMMGGSAAGPQAKAGARELLAAAAAPPAAEARAKGESARGRKRK